MWTKRAFLGGRTPKALLRRFLTSSGSTPPAAEARERPRTVMFTDIAGFTGLAEAMPPADVAELLAGHFALLAAQIERERGRVDKIWGDGLLALWDGAADRGPATTPAVRAALGIRAALAADNRARQARGLPPVRLRVGLHTGPLVMAPMGTAGRLGVTPLGDAVNVAQRLEDAARHVAAEGEAVTVVASAAVVAGAGPGFRFEALGELPVRGRCEPVRAFRLAGA